MATQQKPEGEQRRFRYSLGKMFGIVLVLSVLLALWAAIRPSATSVLVPPTIVPLGKQIDLLIANLESTRTIDNRFAVVQCQKLGPEAAAALPALKELRSRKQELGNANFVARIDGAIAAVEGKAN